MQLIEGIQVMPRLTGTANCYASDIAFSSCKKAWQLVSFSTLALE